MTRRSVFTLLAVAVLSLMVITGLVLAVMIAAEGGRGFALGDRIAVIPLEGIIGDDREVLEHIRFFGDDKSVKGFVFAINSPGGSVGPSQSIYRELKRLRDEGNRPVIASIGAVGASGGYYVAMGADSIFALPGSITGSIGVIMELPKVDELLDKVGIEMRTVQSARHKDIGSPFRDMSPSDSVVLHAMVMDVYDQFVEVVATERKVEREQLLPLADGRILSGRQAQQNGLIDRLGNLNDAVAAAGRMAGLGAKPKVVYPPEEKFTLLDLFFGRVGPASALQGWLRHFDQAAMPRVRYVVP